MEDRRPPCQVGKAAEGSANWCTPKSADASVDSGESRDSTWVLETRSRWVELLAISCRHEVAPARTAEIRRSCCQRREGMAGA